MKTAYLNLRITPEDKKLLSDLAWKNRMSMSEMVTLLIRRAAADDLSKQLEDLKREVAAVSPAEVKINDIAAAPDQPDRYSPGQTPDCPFCNWFKENQGCTNPDLKGSTLYMVVGDCPHWEMTVQD